MRSTALVAALSLATASLGGCKFAVDHPAPALGITTFLIAEGTCAIQTEGEQLRCFEISGTIGLGLGGIVALAMLLGGPGDTVLRGDDEPPPQPLQEEPPDGVPATNEDGVKTPPPTAPAVPPPVSPAATPPVSPAAPPPDAPTPPPDPSAAPTPATPSPAPTPSTSTAPAF